MDKTFTTETEFDQDNLIAAIFSHHRIVFDKIFKGEAPSVEDKQVYELQKFLDPAHQKKLIELLNTISLTRFEASLTQAEILEHIIAFVNDQIDLTKLLAKIGQRSVTAIIELLDEDSRSHLANYITQRFDKLHFYTFSTKCAKENLGNNAAMALVISGSVSLFIGAAIMVSPLILLTLLFSGVNQLEHNTATMLRCLLIAKELKLDLLKSNATSLSETQIENNQSKTAFAIKNFFLKSLPPLSSAAPFSFLSNLRPFNKKNKPQTDDENEIEMEEIKMHQLT